MTTRDFPVRRCPENGCDRFRTPASQTVDVCLQRLTDDGPLRGARFRVLATDLRRLVGPQAIGDEQAFGMAGLLIDGLRDYLTRHQLSGIGDLVGRLDTHARDKAWISS